MRKLEMAMRRWLSGLLLSLSLFMSAPMSLPMPAQSAVAPIATPAPKVLTPVFDVASVKPNKSGGHSSHFSSDGNGYLETTNTTLGQLLQGAYNLSAKRILGGPNWTNVERWDVVAKPDSAVSLQIKKLNEEQNDDVRQEMLRALLEDRFQLVAHKEQREMPIYALVVAKNGPKLTKWIGDDVGVHSNNGHLTIKSKMAMAALAQFLERRLDRVVVDKTGLDGGYELTLNWTQENMGAPKMDGTAHGASTDADEPSVFTALQEQLGLKLESQKGQVQVLVVDKATLPAEN